MIAPPLTPAMLDRFAEALRLAGAPLGDELEPGLSDAEIDAVGGSLAVSIPPELRTLWRWGVPPEDPKLMDNKSWYAIAGFELWPPMESVRNTREYRELFEDDAVMDRIAFGGLSGKCLLMVDTGTDTTASSVIEAPYEDDPFRVAPSIGALIRLWTEQMLTGEYWYDRNRGWLPKDGPMVRIIERD